MHAVFSSEWDEEEVAECFAFEAVVEFFDFDHLLRVGRS